MTTRVDLRKFLRDFSSLVENLRPGEKIIVTRRCKALGEFQKGPSRQKLRMPDFEKLATLPGIDVKLADDLFARVMKGLE